MSASEEIYVISAFYRFVERTVAEVQSACELLRRVGEDRNLRGITLLATEGCNGTVAGLAPDVLAFRTALKELFGVSEEDTKNSIATFQPFKRLSIKIKDEIVTSWEGCPPPREGGNYVTPEEWDKLISSLATADEMPVIIDVRNSYETQLGMFKGAIDPKTENFQQFPQFAASLTVQKDRPIYTYCTGGIRCEKASAELKKLGFEQVFQLQGGILNYLRHFPNRQFDGECFVFDRRVSVTQDLTPSQIYKLCPHCGQPGENPLSCARCGKEVKVCNNCRPTAESCSKDCDYQIKFQRERQNPTLA